MTTERAQELRNIIAGAMQNVSDETALSAPLLFPEWKANEEYEKDYRLTYMGTLYRVLQQHTSQDTWTPEDAPSLFAKVLISDPSVIPEWEQPDSTNPYMAGDKVTFEGNVYESLIDNNIWSPSAYPAGWQLVE